MRALIKNEDGTLEVVEFIDMYIDDSISGELPTTLKGRGF